VTILLDPAYVVPPARPAGPVGTLAWLRASVPRFCEGADHERRRALLERRLATIDPESLRGRDDHVIALAEALGATDPAAAADAVREIAPHYNPPPVAAVGDTRQAAADEPRAGAARAPSPADAAVARLLALLPPAEPEVVAQDICILVQGCAATEALIAARGRLDPPPVPATWRISPAGEPVRVDLSAHPFGAGAHACPGREHALASAER
jgi:cytochrome P450